MSSSFSSGRTPSKVKKISSKVRDGNEGNSIIKSLSCLFLAKVAQADEVVQSMIDWVNSNGGFLNEKVEIRRLDASDSSSPMGVFAKERLEEEEIIMYIPSSLYLNVWDEAINMDELVQTNSQTSERDETWRKISVCSLHCLPPYSERRITSSLMDRGSKRFITKNFSAKESDCRLDRGQLSKQGMYIRRSF